MFEEKCVARGTCRVIRKIDRYRCHQLSLPFFCHTIFVFVSVLAARPGTVEIVPTEIFSGKPD